MASEVVSVLDIGFPLIVGMRMRPNVREPRITRRLKRTFDRLILFDSSQESTGPLQSDEVDIEI